MLFGSSIVQHSYYEGWGATLSHLYARKVLFLPLIIIKHGTLLTWLYITLYFLY